VNESVRVYVDLVRAGRPALSGCWRRSGHRLRRLQTDFESSVNYTLQEYANDIIYHVQNVCDEVGVPHPNIVTESGRAIAAYHSVLVFNVLGVAGMGEGDIPAEPPADAEQPLVDLQETYRGLSAKNCSKAITTPNRRSTRRSICSASAIFRSSSAASPKISIGPSRVRSSGRRASSIISRKSWRASTPCSPTPISAISRSSRACPIAGPSSSSSPSCRSTGWKSSRRARRAGRYHVRFRRQSGRLYRPTRREAHAATASFRRGNYYLGAFLLGAYQEILGDLHNLFGDTNAVHVRLSPAGETILDSVIKGDTVREVLNYVQFSSDSLVTMMRRDAECALREAG